MIMLALCDYHGHSRLCVTAFNMAARTVLHYDSAVALFAPQEFVPTFLNGLTDEDLKKESKTEAKNDALSGIIKALKCLVSRIPAQEETIKNLEIFRLKVILRSVVKVIMRSVVKVIMRSVVKVIIWSVLKVILRF